MGAECRSLDAVYRTPQDVEVGKLVAPILWIRRNDIPKSGTHLKVVRVVDGPSDAQASIPREGGMARHAKHLVAAVHLGNIHATLGALFGVSAELLHGRDVVVRTDVPGVVSECWSFDDGLMTTVARGLITTGTLGGVLGYKPTTLGGVARDVRLQRGCFHD